MTMLRRFFSAFLLLCAGVVPISAASAVVPLVVRADAKRVTITNVTPGRSAYLFGLTLANERNLPTLRRFAEVLADADRDGKVTFAPMSGIPLRAIWVAVDAESGAVTATGREDNEIIPGSLPAGSFRKSTDDLIEAIERDRVSADLLLVRPGEGAWVLRASEGGPNDGDRTNNGRLTLAFSDAKPVDSTSGQPPKHLKKGDVLALIDADQLEVFITTVEK